MRFLLDTNIVSAFAPGRKNPAQSDGLVGTWLEANTESLALTTVSLLEIKSGIERLRLKGAARRAEDFSIWLARILDLYAGRIVPLDGTIARAAGVIEANALSKGHAPGLADIVIAATARVHRLAVVTRNLRHFLPLEVGAFDPFKSLPEP